MRKIVTTGLLLIAANSVMAQPKNVIMYIGDGFGTSAKTAARMAMGQGTQGKRFTSDAGFHILSLDRLKYAGSATTHSANSWITDSGPGASVYAAGRDGKIDNEAISFNVATGTPVETILEKAKKAGYAVGIVTSTRVTHATPAAFASHIWFRDLEDYIAAQYISSTVAQYQAIYNDPNSKLGGYNAARDWTLPAPKVDVEVDVILGGGSRHFLPRLFNDTLKDKNGQPIRDLNNAIVVQQGRRTDSVNLITHAQSRGYKYVNSRDALMNLDTTLFTPTNNAKVIGLFNPSHINYEQDRQMNAAWEPSLFEMTEMAIKILRAKGGTKGFFLMVEGGRIDHLEHANSGGITVIAGTPNNQYTVDADKRSYVGGGEAIYGVTPTTARHTNVYGSDYLIKEVLAFDYSVAQGRKLLSETNSQTLIFSSSDHECGGTAIVGLHDQANAQNNGTMIRTYALGPKQAGVNASSSGAATASTFATPTNVTRGDINFGATNVNGWYPNYTTYTFQNRPELWPQVDTAGRRIVVAYGSNPLTNGNGTNAGGTPGNHTPMDVWVGGDDNVGGTFASQITGIGLFDNTYLTHIMDNFLGLAQSQHIGSPSNGQTIEFKVFPNPAGNTVHISTNLQQNAPVHINILNINGQVVGSIDGGNLTAGTHSWTWNSAQVAPGTYFVHINGGAAGSSSQKIVITH
jgi:alkaline phosphatase